VNSFRLGKEDQASEGGGALWDEEEEDGFGFKSISGGAGGGSTFEFDSLRDEPKGAQEEECGSEC